MDVEVIGTTLPELVSAGEQGACDVPVLMRWLGEQEWDPARTLVAVGCYLQTLLQREGVLTVSRGKGAA